MRYLLLVHSPVSRWDELPTEGTDPDIDGHAALVEFLTTTDRLLQCSPLTHPAAGRAVTIRDGAARVADLSAGGSAVAGYYLIRARDLDDAISVAERVPDARVGHVEVRPLLALEGIVVESPDDGDREDDRTTRPSSRSRPGIGEVHLAQGIAPVDEQLT